MVKIFLAGQGREDTLAQYKIPYVLQSFFYSKNDWKNIKKSFEQYKPNYFLDSGAFSAYTQKKTINIKSLN